MVIPMRMRLLIRSTGRLALGGTSRYTSSTQLLVRYCSSVSVVATIGIVSSSGYSSHRERSACRASSSEGSAPIIAMPMNRYDP